MPHETPKKAVTGRPPRPETPHTKALEAKFSFEDGDANGITYTECAFVALQLPWPGPS